MPVRIFFLMCVVAWGLTGDQHAQGGHKPDQVAVNVPPADELTVLDPRVDAEGKPHPVVVTGADQQTHVDVPPTVIVHNYYYSGDRDFRAPRLTGGPVILVVNDPNTGERQYLEAQLPAGSPRVIYRRRSIEYDFGREQVRVKFPHRKPFCDPSAKVSYHRGKQERHMFPSESARGPVYKRQIASTKQAVTRSAQTVLQNVGTAFNTATTQVATPIVQAVHATPVGALFEERTEDQAAAARDQAVQQAANVQELNNLTIPTNR